MEKHVSVIERQKRIISKNRTLFSGKVTSASCTEKNRKTCLKFYVLAIYIFVYLCYAYYVKLAFVHIAQKH